MGKKKDCACHKCVRACHTNPGWMTPDEADAAMNAGLARRLMRDWWESGERVYVLSPASLGHEGEDAPEMDFLRGLVGDWCRGRCTFLDANNRCEIHASSYKPVECRALNACAPEAAKMAKPLHKRVTRAWNSPRGRTVLQRWQREVGYYGKEED